MNRPPRALTFSGVTVRNLMRQPMRTMLTALGVSVGVIAVVALAAISRGFWDMTSMALRLGGCDLLVFQTGVAADILSSLDEKATRAALASVDAVEAVAGAIFTVQPVNDQPFMVVIGAREDDFSYRQLKPTQGRKPQRPDELMVGRVAAQTLCVKVGDKIHMGRHEFTISGMFELGLVVVDGGVMIDLDVLQEMTNRQDQITAAPVKLKPGADRRAAVEEIERRFPEFKAISEVEEYVKVDRGLVIMQALVWGVSGIAVLVGGLVVLNTMWMSVFERTREIGILRALGWSRRRVVGMILMESALISLLAAAMGSVLGVAVAQLATVMHITEQFVQPVYGPALFGWATLLAVAIGALGGVIPSWRASTFSPVEALRYE